MSINLEPAREKTIEGLGPLYGKSSEFKDAYTGAVKVETAQDHATLEALHRHNFDFFYEQTQLGAPEDCGDERPATKLVDAMLKPLGPQNMGGTSTNALVWGLTARRNEPHLRMIAGLNAAYLQAGVEHRPGGHTAEGADSPNCGCAAIDLIPAVTEAIIDPKRREAHRWLTAAIMGFDNFDERAYSVSLDRYKELYEQLGDYLPAGYQRDSLDLMRKLSPDIEPINKRVGEHKGLAIFANHVPGTRLSQDILASTPSSTGRPFEAFGVDVWYAQDLAQKLFPYDTPVQQEFAVGRLMYDSGSLLVITDGSLELLAHKLK